MTDSHRNKSLAPHVRAAIDGAVQAAMGGRGVQGKVLPLGPGRGPAAGLAAHVRAAIGSSVQARLAGAPVVPQRFSPGLPAARYVVQASRRSSRLATSSSSGTVSANRSTLASGWTAFAAQETDVTTSGTTATAVTLYMGVIPYAGSSASTSHAEMDALNDILIGMGDSLDDVIAYPNKTVDCTAKPCCYRCSIILGLLGFSARTGGTKKTRRGMGQTQWVLPSPLREKIAERWGDVSGLLSQFSNVDKL